MKSVLGYEGLYSVTSCGKVWSHRFNRFLRPCTDKDGYKRVTLTKRGKTKFCGVHRLVLEAYCPIPGMEFLQVNHKSEKKDENWIKNLEWVTAQENSSYGTRSERSGEKHGKPVICIDNGKIYESASAASRATGISKSAISGVCRGCKSCHTAAGYRWEYLNQNGV